MSRGYFCKDLNKNSMCFHGRAGGDLSKQPQSRSTVISFCIITSTDQSGRALYPRHEIKYS